jgi:hypothetical protein
MWKTLDGDRESVQVKKYIGSFNNPKLNIQNPSLLRPKKSY